MTDAPKIDTTREAVERLMMQCRHFGLPHDIRVEATLRALLTERDLAAAQTAAAVGEMREAAAEEAEEELYFEVADAIRELPLPDATALDRLLEAARQDERTAIATYIGMSPSEVTDRQYHMEAIRTGRYRDDPLMQRGGWMEGGDG